MSDEHLWPIWMHKFLPQIDSPRNLTAVSNQNSAEKVETVRKNPRQGHVFTRKIHNVCKSCNSGWMGDTEEAAKPLIIPMLRGNATRLNQESQERLAKWMALKFLVADNDRESTPISQKQILTQFREEQKIPNGLKIWIAHHNYFEWSAGYWAQGAMISDTPKQNIRVMRNNIKTTAFGFGAVFSFSLYTMIDRLDLIIDNPCTTKIWPVEVPEIAWPTPVIPLEGIAHMATILDRLGEQAGVIWGR